MAAKYSVSYTMTAVEEGWQEVEASSVQEAGDKVKKALIDNPQGFMPSGEATVEINDVRRTRER